MNILKAAGGVIILAGALSLIYGEYSYNRETHDYKLGGLEVSVFQTETVDVPLWAGILAMGVGGLMFLLGDKK
jgi:hypothetical protein